MQGATLFVVRVWMADGFRASVRRVDDEDTHWFTSATEVTRYLEISCAARAPETGAGAGGAGAPVRVRKGEET